MNNYIATLQQPDIFVLAATCQVSDRRLRRGDVYAEGQESLRSFWQARFYDFNVFSEKKKKEKLEYMHSNPVTRGLVEHPRDWPWSSWSNYAQRGKGLIAVDLR